jgi:phosphohistidine phosphatase SixA
MRPLSLTLFLALLAAPANAQSDAASLIAEMAQGGLVLYVRHAMTESDYADQVNADPMACSTQRVLSEGGWQQARALGRAFAAHAIPVSEVLASQYCRAWQTADLMFGQYQRLAALNFEPAEDYTDAQTAAMRERVQALVLAPLAPGANRVLVGHDDPFEALTGIYPEPMGVVYVLRPGADGSISVLGHIPPDGWPTAAARP